MTLTIDITTARRFILGKQGLWPGRRYRGSEGTEQAMRAAVAPTYLIDECDEAEADRFLITKDVSFSGLTQLKRAQDAFHRGLPFDKAQHVRKALLAEGELIEVRVESWKAVHYALGRDAGLLAELGTGRVPDAWTPLESSTTDEAVFLAPLDHVSARGRARVLFDFEYVWTTKSNRSSGSQMCSGPAR
jgi:uncharacterized protein